MLQCLKNMRHPKFIKKILLAALLGIDAFIFFVALNHYFPQFFVPYIKNLTRSKNVPLSYAVPQKKSLASKIPPSASSPYSYFGISFSSPWELVKKTEEKNRIELEFVGKKYIIMLGLGGTRLFSLLTQHLEKKQREKIIDILGEENIGGNYELARWLLYTNPDELKISSSETYIRNSILLIPLKILLIKGEGDAIFEFETPRVRGFQIGNPQKEKMSTIQLLLFTKQDTVYNIMVSGSNISQPDIDSLLSSIYY